MKLIFYMLTTAAIFSAQITTAQEEVNSAVSESFKHGFGIHAGASTGLGFSYRYFPEKWGVQVTGIPVFGGGSFFSSAGLSGLYKIKEHRRVDLFTYLGGHLIHERYKTNTSTWPPTEEPQIYKYNTLVAGLGAGVNIHLWEVLDLSVQIGYGAYNLTNSPRTNITGELGFYYRF